MDKSMKVCVATVLAVGLTMTTGCKGEKGDPGTPGTPGAPGAPGAPGTDAVDRGTISGTVKDSSGNPMANATVTTAPPTSTALTDGAGAFTISNVPIGVYTLTATAPGYSGTLAGVGVAGGATTLASVAVSPAAGVGTIAGTVKSTAGVAISGATVSVQGQAASATTDSSGAFTLTNVSSGFVFLSAAPSGTTYLPGETRSATIVQAAGTVSGVDITLSARPGNAATFVGGAACALCHGAISADEATAAHYHSITPDTSRMISLTLWPAVGATVTTSVTALSPVDGTTMVSVSLCQNTAGAYSMKFGGTASDCTVADGTFVPLSGTYGGEGDGGIGNVPNLGKFKQRYLAKLADVPFANGWTYTTAADKARDFLIMPVQITQSGDGAPTLGGYHGNDWTSQGRTFSRACAGCHNTGMSITWDATSTFIASYSYIDLNITCERCHGPGSLHAGGGGGKANNIINPLYLTADAERQVCGQCHAADSGKSFDPSGAFGYAYDAANASALGGGIYVPGVYDVADYIKGLGVPLASGGGFDAWPDGLHGKAHRQQFPELAASVHANNPFLKITCSSCHDTHNLVQGPKAFTTTSGANTYVFTKPTFKSNVLCVACHATHGPYADLTKDDIAAVFVDAGGAVTKDGTALTFTPVQITAAKSKVALSVGNHMQVKVNMGVAAYNPLNEAVPTGRCASCHMPKTGKSGGYTTGLDANGASALVEGDEGSHKFDVIWPAQSAALKKLTGGADTDIMPNSCGKCHAGARLSGN